MAQEDTKLYMELQMEELKSSLEAKKDQKTLEAAEEKNRIQREKNAKVAAMYDDAAEYEADLAGFEAELEIVKANELKNIATALKEAFPDEERDFGTELDTILKAGWTHYVEVEESHPKEQLEIINATSFSDALERLSAAYPDYKNFEADIRALLHKRWENLIEIKKEHIKQELAEIKTTGLKPKYVKRVYEQYHGIKK